MVGKLNRLPVKTQNALQQLACLGNSADFALLTMVYEDARDEMHSDLREAVRAGFVLPSERAYRFLHDRVQEAAYSLIPEELRAEGHLRIGRLLVAHTSPGKREEAIFEIVNQLNRGAALITSRDEREQLAEFNLIAGKRAMASTAYTSALKYLIAGAALLVDDTSARRHEPIFSLELHRAECEFLTGQSAVAEDRLTMLSSRTANTVELATVTCRSRDIGAYLGLVPRRYQSGEVDYVGSISKCGDRRVRTLLYEAANVMLTRYKGQLRLKDWAFAIAKRSTMRKARIALARRLAIIMHAMLRDGTEFVST
jgi:predicted ATPase